MRAGRSAHECGGYGGKDVGGIDGPGRMLGIATDRITTDGRWKPERASRRVASIRGPKSKIPDAKARAWAVRAGRVDASRRAAGSNSVSFRVFRRGNRRQRGYRPKEMCLMATVRDAVVGGAKGVRRKVGCAGSGSRPKLRPSRVCLFACSREPCSRAECGCGRSGQLAWHSESGGVSEGDSAASSCQARACNPSETSRVCFPVLQRCSDPVLRVFRVFSVFSVPPAQGRTSILYCDECCAARGSRDLSLLPLSYLTDSLQYSVFRSGQEVWGSKPAPELRAARCLRPARCDLHSVFCILHFMLLVSQVS